VLHTLHCLNQLRMSIYPATYPQDPVDGPMHKAHCVDHLRQLAMCSADLTPVPTQWFEGLGRNYINSSREHTCRDFSQVRQWATDRISGSSAVKARNRDGKVLPSLIAYDPADLGHVRQARCEKKRWFRGALDLCWQSRNALTLLVRRRSVRIVQMSTSFTGFATR